MSSRIDNVLSNLGEAADVVGFRYWLEKAIRQEDNHEHDWSPHTIDYFMFKQTLKRMARRRAKSRQLLRDSHDGRISEEKLLSILGPPPEPMSFQNIHHKQQQPQQQHGNIFSSTNKMMASAVSLPVNPLATVEMTDLKAEEGKNYYIPFVDADKISASTTTDTESQKSDHHKGVSSGGGGAPPSGVTATSPAGSGIRTGIAPTAAAPAAGNNNNNAIWNRTNSKSKRRTKRSILRRISNLERTEMLSFLTWEMDKVQMFYLAHWQRLSLELEKCTSSSSRPHPEPIHEQQQQTLVPPSSVQGGGKRKQHAHEVSSLMLDAESSDPMSSTTPYQSMGSEGGLNVAIGDEILELLAFCVINIVTARQILIRYDAYCRTFEGTPMMNFYMKQVVKHPTSFRKILHHEEINALADSYFAEIMTHHHHHSSMAMMLHFESQRLMFHDILESSNTATDINHHAAGPLHQSFNSHRSSIINHLDQMSASMISLNLGSQYNVVGNHPNEDSGGDGGGNTTKPPRCRASSTASIDSIISSGRAVSEPSMAAVMEESELATSAEAEIMSSTTSTWGWKDVIIQTIRDWFLLAGGFEDRLGLEPAYLTMRGKSLTSEMQQLAEWRRKKQQGIVLPPGAAAAVLQQEQKEKDLTGLQMYNLTLNLMSAFLYCMNYYIVEPSSTMYVNRLGAPDQLSGTLIGMMPLAAFLSSIPFSIWTNRSFRHPFIMSCTLLIVGNLIYSLADQVHRAEVALLGRFICGLGAPKCIVRRYLADTTPMTLRTSVNAGFGMVVAAGSAMGPATAVLLNKIEYTTPAIPHIGYITLNGLTMPGYFMACLWLTFTVIVVATFEEPDRAGLEEQKRLEAEKNRPSSSLLAASVDDAETSGKSGFVLPTDKPVRVTATSPATLPAHEEDLRTIFSGESSGPLGDQSFHRTFSIDLSQSSGPSSSAPNDIPKMVHRHLQNDGWKGKLARNFINAKHFFELITVPVRICLGLLFAKVFTIEALVSSTSVLSKNRYHWQVQQVGMLGFVNGCLVIPFSVMVGRLSMSYQDHMLMRFLLCIGIFGLFLLIDITDLVATPTADWNQNHPLAVGPKRYITGYFLTYLSVQAFEGVIGSTLSKVIPTALACGTFNSGLLATLVDTLGRACGDMSISLVGLISLRQLMNLLFIPGFSIILTCLVVIERNRDMLAV